MGYSEGRSLPRWSPHRHKTRPGLRPLPWRCNLPQLGRCMFCSAEHKQVSVEQQKSARTSRKFIKVGLFAVAQRLRVSEARCCTAGAETHVSKVSMMERSGRDQKEARVLRSWLKRANMDGRIDLTGP